MPYGFFSAIARLVDLVVIVGPVVGYVLQLHQMRSQRKADGYSVGVSAILLISATLRVAYYFGHPFAMALLLQAILMIFVQILVVVQVQKIRLAQSFVAELHDGPTTPAPRTPSKVALVVASEQFSSNKNTSTSSCIPSTPRTFLCRYVAFVVLLAVSCSLLFASPWVVEAVGYLALGIESLLLTPQLVLNFQRRSTEGVTTFLFVTWVVGDAAKLFYFLARAQPFQFILCSMVQLSFDAVLVVQLWLFAGGDRPTKGTSSSRRVISDTPHSPLPGNAGSWSSLPALSQTSTGNPTPTLGSPVPSLPL